MKCLHRACVSIAVLVIVSSVGADIGIVRKGEALAAIVIAENAPEMIALAAAELTESIAESTGARLPVFRDGRYVPVDYGAQIHVGNTTYVQSLDLPPADLDDDGFIITVTSDRRIVIVGPTDHGTEFGVYEFLERYVGVRWLLPGLDGTDIPQQNSITVSEEQIRQEPAFLSRHMSGYRAAAQDEWLAHMRRHSRISFHHNLVRLFPPEEYTETHPEFFPIHGGERFLPPSNSTHGWQPCFTAPGIVEEAVKNIIEYFDTHPDATSYSLGVNDSSGHCECEDCRALDSGEENFLGRRDVSDRYFTWANQVVEGVLEEYPDKWFGCLAYSEVAEPPKNVDVHPRIVPYMTYDRMKWIKPDLREDGHSITNDWAEATTRLGWYDYIYGTPYCLPRVYFHHRGEYYRWGHEHGVRALYAEAYPNFGEGPKLYVAWKLQWNPYHDVEALLDEWYTRCVGSKAAPYLEKYYALWEDFWTRRILDSAWWTDRGQYLRFNDPAYLVDVTAEDMELSRRWLQAAVDRAGTEKQRARAKLLLDAFEYYEASWVAYQGSPVGSQITVQTEQDALACIEQAARTATMAQKRLDMVQQRAHHPVLRHPINPTRYNTLTGKSWGTGMLGSVVDYARSPGPVRERLEKVASDPDNPLQADAAAILALAAGQGTLLSTNSSFEKGPGKTAEDWYLWAKWGVGSMYRSDEVAADGQWSCCCDGMRRGGPNQVIEVQPGAHAATCRVYVPEGQAVSGTVTLGLTLLDADGQNADSYSTDVGVKPGEWTQGTLVANFPEKVRGQPTSRARLIVIVNGFEPDEEVYVDDLKAYRIPAD